MFRIVIVIVLIIAIIIATAILAQHKVNQMEAKRPSERIPGSMPTAEPPEGKRWALDLIREEWYLDDV